MALIPYTSFYDWFKKTIIILFHFVLHSVCTIFVDYFLDGYLLAPVQRGYPKIGNLHKVTVKDPFIGLVPTSAKSGGE